MELIEFNGRQYPKYTSEGFAAQYAFPFALQVCKGRGVDVGCGKLEWCLPGAIPVDPKIDANSEAMSLPGAMDGFDYIFSSHTLEHIPDWVKILDNWTSVLKSGGILFLYLPHYYQEYWRPWNDRKHLHIFTAEIIRDYMLVNGYKNIFWSERDLNYSFMIYGEKI
jgi:SAM-dependent methyltransferase